jgi:3-keto-L-gulonate-6-phosphate decarboxylase
MHLLGQSVLAGGNPGLSQYPPFFQVLSKIIKEANRPKKEILTQKSSQPDITPYVVADLKMMDRGETEVKIAAGAGADAAVALGAAPTESLDAFIDACEKNKIDAMIDMMNIDFPLHVLRKLKKPPRVVMLHRGVDEENFNKEKQLPLHEIRRIKGNYNDILIAVAGGDTIREVQRSIFNDADIVVVWKSFYQSAKDTGELAKQFLKEIK